MRTMQRLRPLAVWFALCVALVGALVPTVSHAWAWSRGAAPGYGGICTTATPGALAQVIAGSSRDASSGGQGSAAPMEHCPFCLHTSDRCAPPPTPSVYGVLPLSQPPLLADAGTAFFVTSFYSKAAPRGPPVFS